MNRRILLTLAAPAVVLSLACGGVVDGTFEVISDLSDFLSAAEATPFERAQAHCEAALNNTRQYEDVAVIDQRAIGACESWYAHSASEAELVALACMADAVDEAAWDACRAPFTPPEDDDRYGIRETSVLVSVIGTRGDIDREIAENAGVLGALRDGAELDGVFGTSSLDSDLTGGIGGLIGAKGVQIGSGGLGSRGSGLGGGGTAEGLGGLGTKGRGSGASGYGSGGGNFGSTSEGASVAVGDPIILGALDRSLIDAVIKRHMNQIRYCHQRELTTDPSIAGKVVVKFVVAKDGTVSSASIKSTTMNNSAVESCLTSRFLRMQFPEPKGGGIVIVSYPFVFSG
jgi:hypothetical protein